MCYRPSDWYEAMHAAVGVRGTEAAAVAYQLADKHRTERPYIQYHYVMVSDTPEKHNQLCTLSSGVSTNAP